MANLGGLEHIVQDEPCSEEINRLVAGMVKLANRAKELEPKLCKLEVELARLDDKEGLLNTLYKKWPKKLYKKTTDKNTLPHEGTKWENIALVAHENDSNIKKFARMYAPTLEPHRWEDCPH